MTKEHVARVLRRFEDDLKARLATPGTLTDLEAAARKAAGGKKNVSAENTVVGKLLVPSLHSIIEAELGNAEVACNVPANKDGSQRRREL